MFDFESQAPKAADAAQKAQGGQNVYGRYSGYGAMQIMAAGDPINKKNNGYGFDNGWDWNRWPGATTKHLPWTELAVSKDRPQSRSFTDETFVGGVESEGNNGIFAMKLHDTVYDKTFRAEKSVFFFDNELIALGSGIGNDDDKYATETTLFQSMMTETAMPIRVQAEQPVTEFPYRFEVTKDEKAWLMDPYGNGYVVPHANGLRIERKTQSSPDQSGKKTTSGAYSTAWIDHGLNPKDAGYEYAVLVQSAPDQVKRYAEAPNYEVLRKDSSAHIVKHLKQHAIGYVIFDEKTAIEGGHVRKTSRPSIIMEKETGGGIVLSVADPDLRLPKLPDQRMDDDVALTPGSTETVRVELTGSWQPGQSLPSGIRVINGGANLTVLEFDCRNGKTAEVALTKTK